MSSAACYTNKRRVIAQASITKVQYPGKLANNNDAILSAKNCAPNYDILNYIHKVCCTPSKGVALQGILDGGFYNSDPDVILDGGSESTTILDGNS